MFLHNNFPRAGITQHEYRSLYGKILDAKTDKPVEAATVQLIGGRINVAVSKF